MSGLKALIEDLRKHDAWKALGYASFALLCSRELDLADVDVEAILAAKRGQELGVVLAEARANPARTAGAPCKESSTLTPHSDSNVSNVNITTKSGGNRKEYLARRMARDCPEMLDRLEAGEFKSVRSAAIAAGIVKPPTPKDQLAKSIKKVNADGGVYVSLRAVFDAMDDQQRKTAMTMWSDWLEA